MKKVLFTTAAAAIITLSGSIPRAATGDSIKFPMVRSAGAASCLSKHARGRVTVSDLGSVQNMHVEVFDLPAKHEIHTVFDPGS